MKEQILEYKEPLIEEYSLRTGINREQVSIMFHQGKLIEKSGSNMTYLVENPDNINESGNYKKVRKKNTHLTPKKKKRK